MEISPTPNPLTLELKLPMANYSEPALGVIKGSGGQLMDPYLNTTVGDVSNNTYVEEVFKENCGIFDFTVSVLLVGASCVFGFVGNIMSFIILRRDPRKSVTLFLLTALAIVDFMFL